MNQNQSQSSGSAKRKRGRPPGSKNKPTPVAEMLLMECCPKAGCKLTTDAAKVVAGAPTRFSPYTKDPNYNLVKKQKVRCPCGQVYWRFTAIYSTDPKIGLVYE